MRIGNYWTFVKNTKQKQKQILGTITSSKHWYLFPIVLIMMHQSASSDIGAQRPFF